MRVMGSIGRLDFNANTLYSPDAWCRSYAFHNYTIHISWTPEVPQPCPQGYWGTGLSQNGTALGQGSRCLIFPILFSTDNKKGQERLKGEKRSSREFQPLFVSVPGVLLINLLWGGAQREGVPFSALGVHKSVSISQAEEKKRKGQRTSPWICHLGSSINWFFKVLLKGVYHKQSGSNKRVSVGTWQGSDFLWKA